MASALPVVLPIAASALSGYLASRGRTNTSTSATTPTLDPSLGPLQETLIRDLHQRLTRPSALPPGYEASGVGAINRTYDSAAAGIAARNQANGLAGPGALAPLNNLDAARAGQISNFSAVTVPQTERNMHLEDMAQALGLIATGRGSNTNASTTQGAGSAVGGALDSIGSILGFLAATGKLGGAAGQPQPGVPPIATTDNTLRNLFG